MRTVHHIQPEAEPGPYAIDYGTSGVDDVLSIYATQSDRVLAQIEFWSELDPVENAWRESTFRLLAAAPILRDALTRVLANLDPSGVKGELAVAVCEARYALGVAIGPAFTTEDSFLIPTRVRAV